jgi:5-methylcytosine-specific restriction endonuclease McrA
VRGCTDMPWAPKAACGMPGCAGRATQEGRCAQHARPGARQRGYDRGWERRRLDVLRRTPLCGCGAPAVDVHHVRRVRDGVRDDSDTNLIALCHRCHARLTAREDRRG